MDRLCLFGDFGSAGIIVFITVRLLSCCLRLDGKFMGSAVMILMEKLWRLGNYDRLSTESSFPVILSPVLGKASRILSLV